MMKKIYIFILTGLFHLSVFAQSNYNGNGQSGFGGAIGTSSLSVTDDGTNINFTLTRGSGSFNDAFVLYIDSKAGGSSSTTGFSDFGDYLRKAITGSNSVISFPTSPSVLLPDYAIALSPGASATFGGLWELTPTNNFTFVSSVNLTPNNDPNATSYTFTVTKAQLGITGSISFQFVGTYGNPNDAGGFFRSNEGYGTGLPASNPGLSAVTFTSSLTYPLIVTPLHLNTFTGAVKNETIELKWSTLSETNLAKFVVQKSNNGLNFYDIAEVDPKNLANGATYNYIDYSLNNGNNFYRIIARNNVGEKAFSKVIRLLYGKIDNNLTLFPNPTREFLKINFMTAVRGNYKLDIYNDAGQKLITQQFDHNGIDKIINITLPTSMKKGPYRVYISNQYEFYKGTFIVQ